MPTTDITKKLSDRWNRLIGSPASFSLEARIFHSISIGVALLTAVYGPYNLFEGLYVGGVSAILLAVFFFSQYYNSRYRGKAHSSVIFALTGILVFSVNYFSTSGIHGSTDLIWPSYLLLVLAISPYRQHLLWVVSYIVAFFILHLVEYHYPSLVQHPFDLGRGQFIDRVTAFPIPVIGMAIIIIYLRKSYDKERAAAEEKAATIELRNEQILLQKEQLEKSNAEKNKLLSIISHDMRAPFSSIQGYLQLLNQIEMNSQERILVEKELLDITDQTIEMLSNLLYWSHSQMEGVVVNLASLDLLDTISKTIEIEKTLAAKKGIELTYAIDAGITVLADADMLQLVMRNIISNAIKFTPRGGLINIYAWLLPNECRISITDNGTGIAPDKIDTLFAMTSGATYGTNNEKGVGLGLPLCKEFMELQGGRIEFENAVGKGSRFSVYVKVG